MKDIVIVIICAAFVLVLTGCSSLFKPKFSHPTITEKVESVATDVIQFTNLGLLSLVGGVGCAIVAFVCMKLYAKKQR